MVRVVGMNSRRGAPMDMDIAAPIFDYTGNLVATIGCSVPTVRITEESSALLIREVIQTAAAISMSIGAPRREFMPTTRTMLHCPVRG